MRNENLTIASKLINQVINGINDRYGATKEAGDYCMRRIDVDDDDIRVQPTYSNIAYCFDRIIKIADALELNYYFKVVENKEGLPTPTLHIF